MGSRNTPEWRLLAELTTNYETQMSRIEDCLLLVKGILAGDEASSSRLRYEGKATTATDATGGPIKRVGLGNNGVSGAIISTRVKSPGSFRAKVQNEQRSRQQKNAELLQTVEEIYGWAYDLAGVRIQIRYERQVPSVLRYLDAVFHIKEIKYWRQQLPTGFDAQKRFTKLQDAVAHINEAQNMHRFSGYQAIHVTLKLREEDAKGVRSCQRISDWLQVEVQIGSAFMFTYANIAQDLVYKPLRLPDASVRHLIDVVNGNAIAADAILSYIATVLPKTASGDIGSDQSFRDTTDLDDYLFEWMSDKRQCREEDRQKIKQFGWKYLTKFHEVLVLTCYNTPRSLQPSLDKIGESRADWACLQLPLLLLENICSSDIAKSADLAQVYSSPAVQHSPLSCEIGPRAQLLALQLINSLNIAHYFKQASPYIKVLKAGRLKKSIRPLFVDFLDLLDPKSPRISSQRASMMISFCQTMLATGIYDKAERDLQCETRDVPQLRELCDVFTLLSGAGIGVNLDFNRTTTRDQVILPGRLLELLYDSGEEICESTGSKLTAQTLYSSFFCSELDDSLMETRWKQIPPRATRANFAWRLTRDTQGDSTRLRMLPDVDDKDFPKNDRLYGSIDLRSLPLNYSSISESEQAELTKKGTYLFSTWRSVERKSRRAEGMSGLTDGRYSGRPYEDFHQSPSVDEGTPLTDEYSSPSQHNTRHYVGSTEAKDDTEAYEWYNEPNSMVGTPKHQDNSSPEAPVSSNELTRRLRSFNER